MISFSVALVLMMALYKGYRVELDDFAFMFTGILDVVMIGIIFW